MAKVVDNREETEVVIATIIITPNKVDKSLEDDGEGSKIWVITYHTRMVIRYSLQGPDGHLDYKNVLHTSSYTSEPLTEEEVLVYVGGCKPDIKADVLLLSNVDIDS